MVQKARRDGGYWPTCNVRRRGSGGIFLYSLASLGYIPSSVMIPQRRFATLLDQAREYQQARCLYHNAPTNARTFSLYADHICDTEAFPRVTTAILQVHEDEVWNLQWSHSGSYLATASKDKSAIIWRIGVSVCIAQRKAGTYGVTVCFVVGSRSIDERVPRSIHLTRPQVSSRMRGVVAGRFNTTYCVRE